MRTLVWIVLLGACGGGDDAVGEPLIETTLTGDFDGGAFTPAFGFARMGTTTFGIYVGTGKISCAEDFMGTPPNGDFVAIGIPSPTVGSYGSVLFNFVHVDGDLDGKGSNEGLVMVSAVTETEISAILSYDQTITGTHLKLSGSVTLLRCP